MTKKKRYQTRNGAYTSGRKISVKGIALHSYGCAQPDPSVLAERWDSPSANACVHAHIGKDEVVITLPCEEEKGKAARGWHAGTGTSGKSANDAYLSAEMTEPATIKYVSGSRWIELGDGSNTKAHVLATYKNAVDLFAQWCLCHGLDPLADGVILSHKEACARGIASNHGDVEHIWSFFGLTMDQFRQDVKMAMGGTGVDFGSDIAVTDTSGQEISQLSGTVAVIYKGEDGMNIRKAPDYNAEVLDVASEGKVFTVIGISEDEKWYELVSGGFISAVPSYVSFRATEEQKEATAGAGYYRVRRAWEDAGSQIGAFKIKSGAVDLCRQNSGYKVYDPSGGEIYPCIEEKTVPMKVQVKIPDLRIRKGPGATYDYYKTGGRPLYTGEGRFTIVKMVDGPGAKQWGLLKSYSDKENGWISLDDAYVDVV